MSEVTDWIKLNLPDEIWSPIKDYENSYEVSNTGKVRSKKRVVIRNNGWKLSVAECELKQWVATSKYLTVQLLRDGKSQSISVHRLIALAFIPNPENKIWVNHKDGNKLNNSLDNIEWCTPHENIMHAFKHGLRPRLRGETMKINKLTDEIVREIRGLKGTMSSRLIGEKYNVSGSTVRSVLNGRSWTHVK